MFAKAFVFALIALFAFQAEARSTDLSLVNYEADTVAEEIFEQLMKLAQRVREHLMEVIEKLHNQAGEIIEEAKKYFEELVNEAKQLAENVLVCVEEQRPAMDALQMKFITEMQGCLGDKIDKVLQIVNDVQNRINDLIAKVMALKDKFLNCNGSPLCYAGVIPDAISIVNSVPESIKAVKQQVVDVMQEIQAEVPGCVNEKIPPLVQESQKIEKDTATCIHSKVQELSWLSLMMY